MTVMEGGLSAVGARRGRTPTAAAIAAVLLLIVASIAAGDAAGAKRGKVTACVAKKGPDKGAMRFSRSGKCHRGEKRVSWNKKGKQGAAGQTGATGPQGPTGVTDQLLQTIATQQTTIEQLTSELTTVKSQLDALCGQMSTVVTQVNALRAVISGIGLNGVLTTLGGALTFTTPLPAALAPFSCP